MSTESGTICVGRALPSSSLPGQCLCSGSAPAPARIGSCVGCAAMPELRDSASVGRGMLWEQGELAKEKREGGREGE